jgi:hypothetical protein
MRPVGDGRVHGHSGTDPEDEGQAQARAAVSREREVVPSQTVRKETLLPEGRDPPGPSVGGMPHDLIRRGAPDADRTGTRAEKQAAGCRIAARGVQVSLLACESAEPRVLLSRS